MGGEGAGRRDAACATDYAEDEPDSDYELGDAELEHVKHIARVQVECVDTVSICQSFLIDGGGERGCCLRTSERAGQGSQKAKA